VFHRHSHRFPQQTTSVGGRSDTALRGHASSTLVDEPKNSVLERKREKNKNQVEYKESCTFEELAVSGPG
jgi:hypothetical protein